MNIFESADSLKQLIAVMNEASEALKDKSRIIVNSSIPEVLGAALCAGAGGAISFGAIYFLGVAGLSGSGIMSGWLHWEELLEAVLQQVFS